MPKKPELNNGSDIPRERVDESRRGFLTALSGIRQNGEETPSGDSLIENAADLSALNPAMCRRDFNALPIKAALAAIAAKVASLIPQNAEAQSAGPPYSDLDFAGDIWVDLDPSQINTPDFQFLDALDIDKPQLFYEHNVQGKMPKKKGAFLENVPTPSLVFEVAKACYMLVHNKLFNIQERKDRLESIKKTISPGHSDAQRLAEIYVRETKANEENLRQWKPLYAEAKNLATKIGKLVGQEKNAAKRLRTPSPEQSMATPLYIPVTPKVRYTEEVDIYPEVLEDTQPYLYNCDILPSYSSDEPRPQTHDKTTETAFMLRNVARVYREAAVLRYKAYENVLKAARAIPDKSTKAKLNKIGKAGINATKGIRDNWALLLSETPVRGGKRGEIIELVEAIVKAAANEMSLAHEISRCDPRDITVPGGPQIQYPDYLQRGLDHIVPIIHQRPTP